MFQYQTYTLGNHPKCLFFFLHGYNGTLADHQYAIDWLKSKLNSAYLITPLAPEQCDKNPETRQWFGMVKHDPQNLRRNPLTPTSEILSIYDKPAADITKRADEINKFIDSKQKEYGIDNAHTYLCGFSQGAMLTIFTALTRSAPLAGAFAIAGLIAGRSRLEKQLNTRTPITLLHGKEDLKVQYKTLEYTQNWLTQHHIPTNIHTYPQLVHRISEDEINAVTAAVNKTTEA